jgi:hypothetical protein
MIRANDLALASFDPAEQKVIAFSKGQAPLANGIEAAAQQGGARSQEANEIEERVHEFVLQINFFTS